jgi:proteasome inhibitor subunit 1 (PI31)
MVDAKSLLALLRLCPLKADTSSKYDSSIEEDIISRAERLTLAVHMYVLGLGYLLTRTGEGTQLEAENATGFSAEPIGRDDSTERTEGLSWNSTPGVYVFHYTTDGMQDVFHGEVDLKCLIVGEDLIVHVQRHKKEVDTKEASQDSVLDDCSMSLNILEYTTEKDVQVSSDLGYKGLDALVSKLNSGIGVHLDPATRVSASKGLSEKDTESQKTSVPPVGHNNGEMVPPHDGEQMDTRDTRVGYGDVVPPGIRPPGSLGEPGGLGRGGGMMVGPHHPIFGPSRIDDPAYDPSIEPSRGGLPPGARWDPIGPPGTPGFRPTDFQRRPSSREHPHPDIMPPGRGAGTNWDSFFG